MNEMDFRFLPSINYLAHHGILGQKWGIRRFQPYSVTGPRKGGITGKEIGEARSMSKDVKWAKRNEHRIMKKAYKATNKSMRELERKELSSLAKNYKRGKNSKAYINAYNKKLADLMNTSLDDIETPNGRVVRFVAKRGQLGVYMAVTDKGYNMGQVKNGVYSSGRIAYKKKSVDMG